MRNYWIISDTHFGHANFLNFVDDDGVKIRDFSSVEEMDEIMIERWNSLVKPGDRVYHLGDVYFGPKDKADQTLSRLNGKKRLIIGNHDDPLSPVLQKHFKKMMLWRGFPDHGFTCVHIPIEIEQVRDGHACAHGHIHKNRVMTPNRFGKRRIDPRYFNACVEMNDFAPVHVDHVAWVLR